MSARLEQRDLGDGGTGWHVARNDTPARRATIVVALVLIVVVLATGANALLVIVVLVLAGVVGSPVLRQMLVEEEVRVRPDGLRIIQRAHLPGRVAGSPEGVLLRPAQVEEVGTAPASLKRLAGLDGGSVRVRRRATRDERHQERHVDRETREQDREDHHVDAAEREARRHRDAQRADARQDRRTLHFGLGLSSDEADAIATRIRETLRA